MKKLLLVAINETGTCPCVPKHALYLDMGSGWNHAWYRDNGKVVILHPKTHNFCTNWITFYKEG